MTKKLNLEKLESRDCPSAPAVFAVSPTNVSDTGTTLVEILGANLSTTEYVTIGNTIDGPGFFTIIGNGKLLAVTAPPAALGTVSNISVTNPDGTSATSTNDQVTYVAPGPILVNSVTVNQDYIPINGAFTGGINGTYTFRTDGNSGFADNNLVTVSGFTGAAVGFNGTFYVVHIDTLSHEVTVDGDGYYNIFGSYSVSDVSTAYGISDNSSLFIVPSDLAGPQRSMVDSIAYTFNQPVSLAVGAVTLGIGAGTTSGEAPATATPNVVLTPIDGGTTWVATFASNGNASVVGQSIADGIYTATLNSSLVTAGSLTMTAVRPPDTFYRLFGDALGTGRVNSTDSGMLNNSFGLDYSSTGSGYLDYFDYLGNGRINSTDSGELNLNFGSYWRGFAATI
jgi:hypothetical protein